MASYEFVKDPAGIEAMLTSTVRPAVARAAQSVADRARGLGVDAAVRPLPPGDRCAFEVGAEVPIDMSDRDQWHTVGGRHRHRGVEELERMREAMKGAL